MSTPSKKRGDTRRPAYAPVPNTPTPAAADAAEVVYTHGPNLPGVIDVSWEQDRTLNNLIIMDPVMGEVVVAKDGRINMTVFGSGTSLQQRGGAFGYSSGNAWWWCIGAILAVVVVSACASVISVGYSVSMGGSMETMASRTQAFDVNLIDRIMHTVYAQIAVMESQRYELYETQMLCLVALECERFNMALMPHFGVALNCDYTQRTFERECPIEPGVFTPFTFFGLNHTVSGGDIRSVFNHRSSSSNDFDRELASLESRAAPAPVHHGHHRPHQQFQYNDNSQQDYYSLGVDVKSGDYN